MNAGKSVGFAYQITAARFKISYSAGHKFKCYINDDDDDGTDETHDHATLMGKLMIYSKFEHMFWLKIAQKLSEMSIGNGLIQILWLENHDSLKLAIKV